MRRLLIGLGTFLFLLATIALVAPFFLPKDAIKTQVVSLVEEQMGWQLRLDGPVSLSLLPGFSLTAEKVGLSGEAGADGVEFAKAESVEFGLAWESLFGGAVRVTGIYLQKPDIFLEIGPTGLTSWEPRRQFDEAGGTAPAPEPSEAAPEAPSAESGEPVETSQAGLIKRIGIDRLEITQGNVVYSDRQSGTRVEISSLDLAVTAPDLEGAIDLDGGFVWQEHPVAIAGSLDAPLAFVGGKQVPVAVTVSSGDAKISLKGTAGMTPSQADVTISASGPSMGALAGVFGKPLVRDPGSFAVDGRLVGNETAVSVSGLHATVGSFVLDGSIDGDLAGATPALSGRLVLTQGSLADLLALAGQDLAASGDLSADLTFAASGADAPSLLATLDVNGWAQLNAGQVSGLGLSSVAAGDPSADTIKDISLSLKIAGLDRPLALSGAMSWRDEAFTVTGKATPAPVLAGMAAPASVQVKGSRFAAGFDGRVQGTGGVEGAVSVETADLRSLLAWIGQPMAPGGGLKTFKVSGLFSAEENAVGFDETSFSLDQTSGTAKGRIVFGAKPLITASLDLDTLVLDPYLSSDGEAEASSAATGGGNGTNKDAAKGWSNAAIDLSGLKAVNADFAITSKEIRWDQLRIGNSVLKTTIKDGVLNAELQKLSLYEGTATGAVTLNGVGEVPALKSRFRLENLDAHPFLRDAAETRWLHGRAFMEMDVEATGASERQLVSSLSGTAKVEFADGSIRGINIPQMVRGLSVQTLLGWQGGTEEKTDFNSLSASFTIADGIAVTKDLSLIGPLVRMTGSGTTNLPERTLDWRVDPQVVATLEGQAAKPGQKDSELAGLGVPIVIKGSWDNPQIYPDIAGILENPAAAYKQLEGMGGDLLKVLKGQKSKDGLADAATEVINKATGGKTQIDVKKVLEGEVDDQEVLKAVEEGFGLPSGLLGTFGKKKKDK